MRKELIFTPSATEAVQHVMSSASHRDLETSLSYLCEHEQLNHLLHLVEKSRGRQKVWVMLNNKQVSFATETYIYSIFHTELCNVVSKLCPLTAVEFPIRLSRLHITICCTRNKAEFLENGRWFCEDRSHSGRSEKNDPNLGVLLSG